MWILVYVMSCGAMIPAGYTFASQAECQSVVDSAITPEIAPGNHRGTMETPRFACIQSHDAVSS